MKPKKCKGCGSLFQPVRPLQVACGPMCGLQVGRAKQEKAKAQAKKEERKADKVKREKLKTLGEWQAEAQKAVNAFVRLRDRGMPCISCGKPWQPDFQAGHYRSRGAAKNLALDPGNIFGQCVQCNMHKHSNAIEYRIRLVQRVGVEHVERLEADHAPKHYSADDLKAIRADFLARAKALKNS